MNFGIVRELVRHLLDNNPSIEWSLQGLGQLRCYLSANKAIRLHIWDDRYATKNVSPLHDHPWDFESVIVSGSLINEIYVKDSERGMEYQHTQIKCGPGGCQVAPIDLVKLRCIDKRVYFPGETYRQQKTEIHQTVPMRGTITIITKYDVRNDDLANIYWKKGEWISAEPRNATLQEIIEILELARGRFDD